MSRQDANAAFALSSFLQGTNATYIDELYARYEKDPASVDAEWQEFFKSLKDTPPTSRRTPRAPPGSRDNWPLTPRDDLTSALDGNWAQVEKAVGGKLAAKAQARGAEHRLGRRQPGDARSGARPDADPRLPHARPFLRQLDPLGIEAPTRPRRTRSAHLRLHRSRFRPQDLPRSRARPRIRRRCARSSRSASAPTARRSASSSCTSRNAGAEGLDPGAHRGPGQGNQFHPRGPRAPS